jgi:hypothetical protein
MWASKWTSARSPSLQGLAVVTAAALVLPVTPASAQDLFSMIFGGGQRHYRPMPPWEARTRPRVRRAKPAVTDPHGAAGAAADAYKVDPADMGTLKMFLSDRTLARGDIVVTSSGFKVFRGSRSFPYSPSDFAPLEAANVRNLAQLKALEATLSVAHTALRDPEPTVEKKRRR